MDSSSLIEASKTGDLNGVKIALKSGADIHAYDDLALVWSVVNGHLDVTMYLLSQGADLTTVGNLPFTVSVMYKRMDVIELIMDIKGYYQALAEIPPEVQSHIEQLEGIRALVVNGRSISTSKLIAMYI